MGGRAADNSKEELRIALVLNGGVSLAIWMGGAVHEIDRLTRAPSDDQGSDRGLAAYRQLLTWASSTARVDVIAGTSAGGINGAALALSQCNSRSEGMGLLRDTWVDSGAFSRLLRQPFRGSPSSLLKGDDFFLPSLHRAMTQLIAHYRQAGVDERPLDLTITGTLLDGVPGVVVDAAGQKVTQVRHDGLFRFQRGPTHRRRPGDDDFADERIKATVDALALAARTTASYPVAFEPSFVPTSSEGAGDYRPDMTGYVSGAWDQSQDGPRARYVVDGGVLANTPTRTALEAVDRMPVAGLVRRVLVLVHPHAPAPGLDEADTKEKSPSLTTATSSLLKAITSQGSRNYVDEIHAHNKLAAQRRLLRGDVVTSAEDLGTQSQQLYSWYRRVRSRRLSRELTDLWFTTAPAAAKPERYDVVFACIAERVGPESGWLPARDPTDPVPAPGELGFEGALGVADAATDYLRRLNWVVTTTSTPTVGSVDAARGSVSAARNRILQMKEEFTSEAAHAAPGLSLEAWVDAVRTLHSALPTRLDRPLADVATALVGLNPDGSVTPATSSDPDLAVLAGFRTRLFEPTTAPTGPQILERLNHVQLVTYVLSDEVTTGASLPIDLAQLTFQVEHDFAPVLTGSDKVAGDVLGRFSAFLKASWRMNDWIWGRLDASNALCRVVLDPPRVRRFLQASNAAGETTAGLVRALYLSLFPGLEDEQVSDLGVPARREVEAELVEVLGGTVTRLELLPRVFATSLALAVAADEMPELVRAVKRDTEEGASRRAVGTVAVLANEDVLTAAGGGDPGVCRKALGVFARSGLGAESLGQEATSDQMITTAASTAAVAVTLADSDASGLGKLKPITRAVRGAALLPYWAVAGLASGGRLARSLALTALAVGGVLLALGLFGLGPSWGVAVGAGAALGAFAYGALRTGTLLHSVVLLVPALAFLAWAGQQYAAAEPAAAGQSEQGLGVLLAVLVLVVGLVVLGSLTPPVVSPVAWVRPLSPWAWVKRSRRHRLVALLVAVAVLGVLVVLLLPALRARTGEGLSVIGTLLAATAATATGEDRTTLLVAVIALYIVAAGVYAYWVGTQWRLVLEVPGEGWTRRDVEHTAGVTAGWSWVYGAALLAACALVLVVNDGVPVGSALRAALTGAGVAGVVLALPLPWALHRRARTTAEQRAADALAAVPGQDLTADPLTTLAARGLNYAYFMDLGPDSPTPTLTAAGRRLLGGTAPPPSAS